MDPPDLGNSNKQEDAVIVLEKKPDKSQAALEASENPNVSLPSGAMSTFRPLPSKAFTTTSLDPSSSSYIAIYDQKTMERLPPKPSRRPNTNPGRQNRGQACEKHHKAKHKCDPNRCPDNKQNQPKPRNDRVASAGTGCSGGGIAQATIVRNIVETPPKPGEYGDWWDGHDRVEPGGMGADGGGYLKDDGVDYYQTERPHGTDKSPRPSPSVMLPISSETTPLKPGEYGDWWDGHDSVEPGGMGADGGGYPKDDGFGYYQVEWPHGTGEVSDDIGSITDRLGSVDLSPDYNPPRYTGNITYQPRFEESQPPLNPSRYTGNITYQPRFEESQPAFSPPHDTGTYQPGFGESSPASGPLVYRSGWFCPYNYESSQNCLRENFSRFGVKKCFGPLPQADGSFAKELKERCTNQLKDLCELASQNCNQGDQMIILFMSNRSLWPPKPPQSTELTTANLAFQILDYYPALVLPVTTEAPLYAWSPWTLSQMLDRQRGYSKDLQVKEICNFLTGITDRGRLPEEMIADETVYKDKLEIIIGGIVKKALNNSLGPKRSKRLTKSGLDPERAAIVMLRFV